MFHLYHAQSSRRYFDHRMPMRRSLLLCSKQRVLVLAQHAGHAQRFYSQGGTSRNPFLRYVRSLKWTPIPLTVGFAYIGYQQFGHILEREDWRQEKHRRDKKQWPVRLYVALPLRAMSRLWGWLNDLDLPIWLRRPVLGAYAKVFHCNLSEPIITDITQYRNLGEFFRRRLTPGCRPVNRDHSVLCPSDGRVLHFGRIDGGQVEQVKGVTYPLSRFLGPSTWRGGDVEDTPAAGTDTAQFADRLKLRQGNELYHCVIYLAPGDYHGFHSPAQWTVNYRRHFPGELLSVNPSVARWLKGLFNLNERAVYMGQWQHGFFSMAAVGATNVGSIRVYHDQMLDTNVRGRYKEGSYIDADYLAEGEDGVAMKPGESFGEFNLGSTIVLIFEAPTDFDFKIVAGQKVKYGQPLGGS